MLKDFESLVQFGIVHVVDGRYYTRLSASIHDMDLLEQDAEDIQEIEICLGDVGDEAEIAKRVKILPKI